MATLESYVDHARLFGTECVVESVTARRPGEGGRFERDRPVAAGVQRGRRVRGGVVVENAAEEYAATLDEHRVRFAAEYLAGTEPPLHPNSCGPCPDCAEALADYGTILVYRTRVGRWGALRSVPPADPVAAAAAATFACGEAAGEYAGTFWRSRAQVVDDPVEPSERQLDRHSRLYGDEGMEQYRVTRTQILKRDRWRCRRRSQKKPGRVLGVHHVVPRADGGSNTDGNLVTLCRPCHDWVEVETDEGRLERNLAAVTGSWDGETLSNRGRRSLEAARLSKQGLGVMAIADRLGVSDATARRYLAEVQDIAMSTNGHGENRMVGRQIPRVSASRRDLTLSVI